METLEKLYRFILLLIGITGVVVLYAGNLYLLFDGAYIDPAMLFFLPCPLMCLYFGLNPKLRAEIRKLVNRKNVIKA